MMTAGCREMKSPRSPSCHLARLRRKWCTKSESCGDACPTRTTRYCGATMNSPNLSNSDSPSPSPPFSDNNGVSWETLFVGLFGLIVALFLAYQPMHLKWLVEEHRVRMGDPLCPDAERQHIETFLRKNYAMMRRGWLVFFLWSIWQSVCPPVGSLVTSVRSVCCSLCSSLGDGSKFVIETMSECLAKPAVKRVQRSPWVFFAWVTSKFQQCWKTLPSRTEEDGLNLN